VTKVVDFCTFYGECGSENLLLRYEILKEYVDEFVVSESSCSHSGSPVQFKCKEKIREWGLPEDKFRIIELNIPESDSIDIQEIDRLHCINDNKENDNLESKLCRARSRIGKDSLLYVIDNYDDDTIFFHGDIDEIVNPLYINDIVNILNDNENSYIKIPLVYLEASADLRVYNKNDNSPQPWDWALFACKKKIFKKATPMQIRSSKINSPELYEMKIVENQSKKVIEEMGWHFSWMGNKNDKIKKCKEFEHSNDKFEWLKFRSYDNFGNFYSEEFEEGDIPPSGNVNFYLKRYNKNLLPKECVENSIIKEFLFQSKEENDTEFKVNKKSSSTGWIVDNFYEYPDKVREFALKQYYVEGGFGRGFIGRRTEQQFLFPGLKEKFEEIIGMKITEWESHGMNGRFQNCHSGEPLVYHCDSQKWGGMLYLTPSAPYQCGTTLYAHKKTRARSYNDQGWDASWANVPGDPHLDGTPFEPVDVLGNVYNRLVIFDASCIHSASEYFGTVMENSRLWQMFFFDT